MTQLEVTIFSLIDVFKKYAEADGNDTTLSKAEVKKLLMEEFPGLLQNSKKPQDVDQIIKDLDQNGDSEIDFKEFLVIVGIVAWACHSRCTKK